MEDLGLLDTQAAGSQPGHRHLQADRAGTIVATRNSGLGKGIMMESAPAAKVSALRSLISPWALISSSDTSDGGRRQGDFAAAGQGEADNVLAGRFAHRVG